MKYLESYIRELQSKKYEILGELEQAKHAILKDLSCLDKCTLTKLRFIVSDYERLESAIDLRIKNLSAKIDSFIKSYEGGNNLENIGVAIDTIEKEIATLNGVVSSCQTSINLFSEEITKLKQDLKTENNETLESFKNEIEKSLSDLEKVIGGATADFLKREPKGNDVTLNVFYNVMESCKTTNDYTCLQGGCFIGNDMFLQAFTCMSDPDSALTKLRKWHVDGTVVADTMLPCYHGQSLTYNEEKNIVTVATTHNNSMVNINPDTMNIISTWYGKENTLGIAYDKENKRYLTVTNGVNKFIIYDENFNYIETVNFEQPIPYTFVGVDIETDENYIYLMISMPNKIIVYDKKTFEIVMIYNLDYHNDFCIMVESESLIYTGNDNFIITFNTFNNSLRNGNENILARLNFKQGQIGKYRWFPWAGSAQNVLNVNVDPSYSGTFSDGTTEYPFKDLQQALNFVRNIKGFKGVQINCKKHDYPAIQIIGMENVRITFDTGSTIDGMSIEMSNNIRIMSVTVNGVPYGNETAVIRISQCSNIIFLAISYNDSEKLHYFIQHSDVITDSPNQSGDNVVNVQLNYANFTVPNYSQGKFNITNCNGSQTNLSKVYTTDKPINEEFELPLRFTLIKKVGVRLTVNNKVLQEQVIISATPHYFNFTEVNDSSVTHYTICISVTDTGIKIASVKKAVWNGSELTISNPDSTDTSILLKYVTLYYS